MEKKRELDKKKAHLATLDAQQAQVKEKQREQVERLLRHTAAVHECAEQVEILESENAQLLNEVQQPVPSHPVIEQEDSEDEKGIRLNSRCFWMMSCRSLRTLPSGAKNVGWSHGRGQHGVFVLCWRKRPQRPLRRSMLSSFASSAGYQPDDLHEMLMERCRREQLGLEQSAREECEVGLGSESGGQRSTIVGCCEGESGQLQAE